MTGLPITTAVSAFWWFFTALLLGFGWTVGCWLAGQLTRIKR